MIQLKILGAAAPATQIPVPLAGDVAFAQAQGQDFALSYDALSSAKAPDRPPQAAEIAVPPAPADQPGLPLAPVRLIEGPVIWPTVPLTGIAPPLPDAPFVLPDGLATLPDSLVALAQDPAALLAGIDVPPQTVVQTPEPSEQPAETAEPVAETAAQPGAVPAASADPALAVALWLAIPPAPAIDRLLLTPPPASPPMSPQSLPKGAWPLPEQSPSPPAGVQLAPAPLAQPWPERVPAPLGHPEIEPAQAPLAAAPLPQATPRPLPASGPLPALPQAFGASRALTDIALQAPSPIPSDPVAAVALPPAKMAQGTPPQALAQPMPTAVLPDQPLGPLQRPVAVAGMPAPVLPTPPAPAQAAKVASPSPLAIQDQALPRQTLTPGQTLPPVQPPAPALARAPTSTLAAALGPEASPVLPSATPRPVQAKPADFRILPARPLPALTVSPAGAPAPGVVATPVEAAALPALPTAPPSAMLSTLPARAQPARPAGDAPALVPAALPRLGHPMARLTDLPPDIPQRPALVPSGSAPQPATVLPSLAEPVAAPLTGDASGLSTLRPPSFPSPWSQLLWRPMPSADQPATPETAVALPSDADLPLVPQLPQAAGQSPRVEVARPPMAAESAASPAQTLPRVPTPDLPPSAPNWPNLRDPAPAGALQPMPSRNIPTNSAMPPVPAATLPSATLPPATFPTSNRPPSPADQPARPIRPEPALADMPLRLRVLGPRTQPAAPPERPNLAAAMGATLPRPSPLAALMPAASPRPMALPTSPNLPPAALPREGWSEMAVLAASARRPAQGPAVPADPRPPLPLTTAPADRAPAEPLVQDGKAPPPAPPAPTLLAAQIAPQPQQSAARPLPDVSTPPLSMPPVAPAALPSEKPRPAKLETPTPTPTPTPSATPNPVLIPVPALAMTRPDPAPIRVKGQAPDRVAERAAPAAPQPMAPFAEPSGPRRADSDPPPPRSRRSEERAADPAPREAMAPLSPTQAAPDAQPTAADRHGNAGPGPATPSQGDAPPLTPLAPLFAPAAPSSLGPSQFHQPLGLPPDLASAMGHGLAPQAAPAHGPMALPRHLPSDFARAAARAETEDRVELLLDPVELGRLRFELAPGPDRIDILVAVERPETLELLRRNMDLLRDELRESGFGSANLSFGHWGQGSDGQSGSAPDATLISASLSDGLDPLPPAPLPPTPSAASLAPGGLDLRL